MKTKKFRLKIMLANDLIFWQDMLIHPLDGTYCQGTKEMMATINAQIKRNRIMSLIQPEMKIVAAQLFSL